MIAGRSTRGLARSATAAVAALLLAALLPTGGCRRGGQPPPDAPGSPRKIDTIVLFTLGPPDDRGLNQSAADALSTIGEREGIRVVHRQVAASEAKEAIVQAGRQGAHLLVLVGEEYLSAATGAAGDVPTTRLVCIGPRAVGSDVETVWLRVDQAGYLCGMLAASITQTGRAAAIGDDHSALEANCLTAFANGVYSVRPAVLVRDSVAFEPTDSAIAEVTRAAIAGGADVIFQAVSRPSAAFEATRSLPNVYVFGSFADQSDLAPQIVPASAVVDMHAVLSGVLDRARRGEHPDRIEHSLADGTVRLVLNPRVEGLLSEAALAGVAQAADRIKAGLLDVQKVASVPATAADGP